MQNTFQITIVGGISKKPKPCDVSMRGSKRGCDVSMRGSLAVSAWWMGAMVLALLAFANPYGTAPTQYTGPNDGTGNSSVPVIRTCSKAHVVNYVEPIPIDT